MIPAGLLYPGSHRHDDPIELDGERLLISWKNGGELAGWWFPRRDARATVVFWFGNEELVQDYADLPCDLDHLSVNICMVDYPGYGQSTGHPSERTIADASGRVLRHVRHRKDARGTPIILYGRSLGGAVAIRCASVHKIEALAIESTFCSTSRVASEWIPGPGWLTHLPIKCVTATNQWDSLSRISNIHVPSFIAHADDDDVIPFEHAETLFEAMASHQKSLVKLESGGHNDYHLGKEQVHSELNKLIGLVR